MPPGVSDRSLVQRVKHVRDDENNVHYIFSKAYEGTHPKMPDISGTVLADTLYSGIIIRSDPNQPDSTKLTMIFRTDFKGMLPTSLINLISEKGPKKWMESLTQHHKKNFKK